MAIFWSYPPPVVQRRQRRASFAVAILLIVAGLVGVAYATYRLTRPERGDHCLRGASSACTEPGRTCAQVALDRACCLAREAGDHPDVYCGEAENYRRGGSISPPEAVP
jgi:hypothetical protein